MYRLPDSFDLAEIAHLSDVAEARQTLLERCILQATRDGAEVALDQVPDGVVAQVAEQMAAHDPLAEIELALACPTCGHQWRLFFDIASFHLAQDRDAGQAAAPRGARAGTGLRLA